MSALQQKEDELMKMNQQIEQQRQALKQDYINYKNNQQFEEDEQDEEEQDYKYNDDDENSENDNEEFNDVYQNDDDSNDEGIMTKILKNVKDNEINQANKQQNIMEQRDQIKFEDKHSEVLELELLVDEQKKMIRVQNIKMQAIKQDYEQLESQNRMKENLIQEIEQKGKNLVDQSKKYNAQIVQLNEKLESLKIKTTELQSKQKQFEKENSSMLKEVEYVKKEFRKHDSEANKKDIKINRAVEDINKLRLSYQQSKLSHNDKSSDLNQGIEQLKNENQRIEKQISESLQSIKKQLKLQDVLKKQRLHIIAARMLQFIESDFMKSVEQGQKISKQQ